jgi:short-subunit dehydrogenase
MKVNNKIIVVTGGGSGMGRELALLLLNKGAKVAVADVNIQGMEETVSLAGELKTNISTHQLDISNREDVLAFPEKVIAAHGAVDGIINNAGIIHTFTPVSELEFDKIERIMNINFYGALNMIKAFLPHLLKRPTAHIANVSSMGGFMPFPGQTIYGASKAAIKLLTEGLHAELADTNVKVTVIFPGAVNTNITSNSGLGEAGADEEQAKKILSASEAAKIMINGIEDDKYRVLVGKDANMLDKLYRLSPAWAAGFIAKKMKKNK